MGMHFVSYQFDEYYVLSRKQQQLQTVEATLHHGMASLDLFRLLCICMCRIDLSSTCFTVSILFITQIQIAQFQSAALRLVE